MPMPALRGAVPMRYAASLLLLVTTFFSFPFERASPIRIRFGIGKRTIKIYHPIRARCIATSIFGLFELETKSPPIYTTQKLTLEPRRLFLSAINHPIHRRPSPTVHEDTKPVPSAKRDPTGNGKSIGIPQGLCHGRRDAALRRPRERAARWRRHRRGVTTATSRRRARGSRTGTGITGSIIRDVTAEL
ncbi:unnamed protein product [Phyllotreta striolata]|uniref:Uncharacterized protein n=1 Tax=Phyllotreta striolata TaxID=444603 RepID=A0A9N9TX62_PHYSR|nr:unnamed protein product [Phyllotreta striolata]